MSFKSSQSTSKYHYEKQLKEDTLIRLKMYLITTSLTGRERVKIWKRLEECSLCDFDIVWAKLPGNILMKLV